MKHSEIKLQIENIKDSVLAMEKENLQGVKGNHFDASYIQEKMDRISDYCSNIEEQLEK